MAPPRSDIDWNDLRYVLAVHREGTLVAAARALRVDKATVGRRIAAAEKALGARLFDRTTDGLLLSEQGRRVLRMLEGLEQVVAAVEEEVAGDDDRPAGAVSITCPIFFAHAILVPALPRLRAAHPADRPRARDREPAARSGAPRGRHCAAGLGHADFPYLLGDRDPRVRRVGPATHTDIYAVVSRALHRTARVRATMAFLTEIVTENLVALEGGG